MSSRNASTLGLRERPRSNSSSSTGTSTSSTAPPARRRHILRRFWLPAVLLLALAAGGLTGIIAAYQINYSRAAQEVASLATYRPSVVTRVYADDGETIIGEFALEKRIPLKFEEIPPLVKNAILAIEDARFYDHIGIDPIRIIGATWKNITTGSREGGSTLTQQLAKNLFLSKEQTVERKVNEWLISLQIERFYTKNQIMEMYTNHVFLGANSYGFEAASETYFGKQAKELSLEEAALLAGIPKAPSEYSPTVNPKAARERRNLVLDQMAKNGFATQAEVDAAKAKPIKLADTAYYQTQDRSSPFAYPVEKIRQDLEEKYTTRVAQGGLKVYTTINVEAQKKAVEVVRKGLRQYDQSHSGWRSAYLNIAGDNGADVTQQQLDAYKHPDWYGNQYAEGQFIMGLVMKVDRAKNEATVRFGNYTATVSAKEMGKSGRQPRDEFKPGFLAQFEVKQVDDKERRLQVELTQIPDVQAALMTLNAKTGEIVAMVGGYDFYTNKFNNAMQAYRQTGSAFKPFIYTAAVEWGMTPDSAVSGAPIKIGDWTPHNYDGSTSHGNVPMKVALAKSLNIAAVHLLQTVGIQTGSQMVRRFGIKVPMAPYLPSALGATEVPLDQMVSAYSAFPNKGVRVEPHLIRKVLDRDGNVLEEWEKTTYKVMNEYVALTMVSMMRGVTAGGGTASAASSIGHPVAGKTGTVNDHTDVWFIGYTPTYVTGVWMGYPGRKKNLGNDMTGGRGALPMFVDFMKDFLKDKPKEDFPKAPTMPEDMKELQKQRQREMMEGRLDILAARRAARSSDDDEEPAVITAPKMEQVTLPPAPKTDDLPPPPVMPPPSAAPAKTEPAAAPPQTDTRPRQVEQPKKKGKKGTDEP
ncbi:MAG TPA: PBP1A family penicillin-binding protein [Pyrinomonadaceae bacterium]|nr:PBP1A family penicillin-binding protein [Pyrinomonadaceae bacterium]